jgi:hypothetical protein
MWLLLGLLRSLLCGCAVAFFIPEMRSAIFFNEIVLRTVSLAPPLATQLFRKIYIAEVRSLLKILNCGKANLEK